LRQRGFAGGAARAATLFDRLTETMEERAQTTSPGLVLDTPLAATHLRGGAKMGVWFGCALPDNFGDAAAEYCYAQKSVALIDKNYRAYLSFAGPDRVRYLNAILTNNIKGLSAEQGNVSLLLNPQGHILAEIETYALADKLFCVSYAMIRERLIEWLDKYIIMDDVTLTDETERFGTLALEGPKATAVVREVSGVDIAPLVELSSRDGVAGSIPCRVVKRSPGGVAGAEFVVERGKLAELWQILVDASRKQGGGPMGYTALSARRLELGVPWFGYDFGEKQIPHEAGLETSHISYTKGCYTGQEIVERVRSRGQVNRRRVELMFSGEAVPEAGAVLTLDGKEMGYVTRAAKIPNPAGTPGTRVIGMGYVRKEGNAVGATLQWARGTVTVAQFPEALKTSR
jgi:folate-binding protein YgfZ